MIVNFFIVGAPKSGTTSLYKYLDQHEDICMSSIKEPNYFSSEELNRQDLYYKSKVVSNIDSYKKLFVKKKDKQILGEASVSYLFYKNVPEKIVAYNKKAKIIIILRNPVERAYSHYLMDYRLGYVKVSLDEILNNSISKNYLLFYQQYIELGLYYNQVKRYIDVFGKENVCVKLYDELNEDNRSFTNNIISFLNLELQENIDFTLPYNKSKSAKNSFIQNLYSFSFLRKLISILSPNFIIRFINKKFFNQKSQIISVTLENKLRDLYSEDIRLLEKMLDLDLSSWRK